MSLLKMEDWLDQLERVPKEPALLERFRKVLSELTFAFADTSATAPTPPGAVATEGAKPPALSLVPPPASAPPASAPPKESVVSKLQNDLRQVILWFKSGYSVDQVKAGMAEYKNDLDPKHLPNVQQMLNNGKEQPLIEQELGLK